MIESNADQIEVCIQVRMTSSRLPGKALLQLGKRSVLDTLVNRLVVRGYKPIILTSKSRLSDPIEEYGQEKGILVLRGSETDVLSRFISLCDERAGKTRLVRITADNPLTSIALMEELIRRTAKKSISCATFSKLAVPEGIKCELVDSEYLFRLKREGYDKKDREHVTYNGYSCTNSVILSSAECYKVQREDGMNKKTLTLDTLYDYCNMLAFLRKIDDGLRRDLLEGNLDIVDVLMEASDAAVDVLGDRRDIKELKENGPVV